jgi:hypothetical protein
MILSLDRKCIYMNKYAIEHQIELKKISNAYLLGIYFLFPLIVLYWSMMFIKTSNDMIFILNSFGPIYFILIMVFIFYSTLKSCSQAILTGVVWFPMQSAVFFGFGPLVELFGSDATKTALSLSFTSINEYELLRANALSITGIFLVIFGIFLQMKISKNQWLKIENNLNNNKPVTLALIMIILSGILKYTIINPSQWSGSEILLPASLTGLNGIIDFGFCILAIQIALGEKKALRIFTILWPMHIFLCILSFSKASILSAMLLPIIGFFIGNRRYFTLFIGCLLIVLIYPATQSWVSFARGVVEARTGSAGSAGYVERAIVLKDFLSPSNEAKAAELIESDTEEKWWLRLNYAGVQARAMSLYDQGQGNPMLGNIWVYFVPRFVWPSKPNLSLVAVDFYRLASGNPNGVSLLGISFYGDLYWQYGWMGVFIGCPLIGWLFGYMAANSLKTIRQRNYIMMPTVFMALVMSLSAPTEFVMGGVIGGSVIYFTYLAFFRLIGPILSPIK